MLNPIKNRHPRLHPPAELRPRRLLLRRARRLAGRASPAMGPAAAAGHLSSRSSREFDITFVMAMRPTVPVRAMGNLPRGE